MPSAAPMPDTDSEEELPPGWEERTTEDGKIYYANHEGRNTQWTHPKTGKRKRIAGELPHGWERKVDPQTGNIFYVDHINKKTSFTDPRLAFAVEDRDETGLIRQRFDGCSTGLQIALGRDLSTKTAIVTGANCGIGYETARTLALHGCHVILACRDLGKGEAAVKRLRAEQESVNCEVRQLDLASLHSVQRFVSEYKERQDPLHLLILNAGRIGAVGGRCERSEDGYEMTFQVNHLAHYLLTASLQGVMLRCAPARVVVLASESHRFTDLSVSNISEDKLSGSDGYSALSAYNMSKLCNVLHSNYINRTLADKGVVSNAVHPGNLIRTEIGRRSWLYWLLFTLVRPFTKSLQQGAATSIYAAIAPELDGVGGLYFNNCCSVEPSQAAQDVSLAERLVEISRWMVERALADTGERSDS